MGDRSGQLGTGGAEAGASVPRAREEDLHVRRGYGRGGAEAPGGHTGVVVGWGPGAAESSCLVWRSGDRT